MDSFRSSSASNHSIAPKASQPSAHPVATSAPPKRPSDSYVEYFLRFKSNPAVLDDYIDPYNAIRVGKILEDLDTLAAAIAFLHIDGPDPAAEGALTIVTASVDRIDLLHPFPTNLDLKMSGFVSYIGDSSIEISISMESCPDAAPREGSEGYGYDASLAASAFSASKHVKQILTAKFIMVALDRSSRRPAKVNPLILESQEDERLFQLGAEHRVRKRNARASATTHVPPSPDEMRIVHDLYRESTQYLDPDSPTTKPSNIIWMNQTSQSSLTVCMPQERNLHYKMFGGYLMRLALELASANATIFAKSPIVFIALDDIVFRKPVGIGSLLLLSSRVVFSPGAPSHSFQVSVVADVIDPLINSRETTNTFHFTFSAPKSDSVPRVLPQTYDESMMYIEGRRRKLLSRR